MTPGGLTLPEGTRLVHIGPPKTGTTAIQVAMVEARDRLAEHGVTYVTATGHRARKAGWALGIRGRPAGSEQPPIEHWERFAAAVAAVGFGRVCVSNEDFGRATRDQIDRVVDDLGGDRVHVVAVARRLDRYLPSQWQESVKAGEVRPYDEWLRVVLEPGDPGLDRIRRNVWFSHDVPGLVSRWVEKVGEDRFTLILGSETDRELLPRTFEALLALPERTLGAEPSRSNRGLGWAETELVREINRAMTGFAWSRPQRRRLLIRGVVDDMRSRAVPAGPTSPPLPDWAADRLRELGDQRVEQVKGLGVRVVGDPETMRMPADVAVAASPLVPPPLPPDLAAHAVAAVIRQALADS